MHNLSTSPQQVLVAGGAGFLGAHLCRRLLDDGHHVVCVDNFQTGRRQAVSALKHYPRFAAIQHDVIQPLALDFLPTQIYNLACPASPLRYQEDPVHTLRTCVDGAYNLLELARRTGARILQASTSEVYGDPLVHPQIETYRGNVNMLGVRACYDEGKRCAETLFSDYGRSGRVTIKIARIFNTYGPGMAHDDGRVVSNLVVQALAKRNLTIYGDGSQSRALCYIDDMIEGLVRLMNSDSDFHGPVNLGCPKESTVLEIARRIRRLTDVNVSFEFLPLPADDPLQRRPDITLARSHLNWEPQTSLDTGLRRTIDYFAEMISAISFRKPALASAADPGDCKASWG
jgi:UDP-glucuronate decarboxylase